MMGTKDLEICERVLNAYLAFGPVDDGRPEGKAFAKALDKFKQWCESKRAILSRFQASQDEYWQQASERRKRNEALVRRRRQNPS
jgi:hypothetical protein